jgi:restriction system protein
MGYQVVHTGGSGDQGVDLSCWDPGTLDAELIVQCKRYKHKVGVRPVRALYGVLVDREARAGCIVTTSDFTEPAKSWAEGKPIMLIGRHELAQLLDVHLSSRDGPPPGPKQLSLFD